MIKSPNQLQSPSYLGDGVYVGHDGYQTWIVTFDGIRVTNQVALEPGMVQKISDWHQRVVMRGEVD